MKLIPLTQGKFAKVDDTDYEWLSQWKWHARKNGNAFYASRQSIKIGGKQKTIRMHIAIIGKREGFITDHINGDGLDNQRHNLRHATPRQNQQNQHVETSSRFPGVYWRPERGKWQAQIKIGRATKYLGIYASEEAAFNAYRKAVNGIEEGGKYENRTVVN